MRRTLGIGGEIIDLLEKAVALSATDLHLHAGTVPHLRVQGRLVALDDEAPLRAADTQRLAASVLTERHQRRLRRHGDVDVSLTLADGTRIRIAVYRQQDTLALAARVLAARIPSVEWLGLPPVVQAFAQRPHGLVLITGPTGAGKSTTLAALIALINRTQPKHIVTIEDPIEFVYEPGQALIEQREVRRDTPGFVRALRAVVRQDPDVVVVGELRDADSIQAALTLAETGHLTFGTLHTSSAGHTVHRLVDAFPSVRQEPLRAQLALALAGIVSQALLPRADGHGRVLALEILVATPAIRTMIRDGRVHELAGVLHAGRRDGMQTLNQALATLVRAHTVRLDDARAASPDPQELHSLVRA